MASEAELLALAERCEAASGPDRELDVAIVYALHPGIGTYAAHCEGEEPIFWHDPYHKRRCPKFTASLDAAMTLVPDGYGWVNRSTGYARVYPMDKGDYEGFAATPALALCAAALKARAATMGGSDD